MTDIASVILGYSLKTSLHGIEPAFENPSVSQFTYNCNLQHRVPDRGRLLLYLAYHYGWCKTVHMCSARVSKQIWHFTRGPLIWALPLSSNFTKLRVHSSRVHWLIQPCYHDVWIWLYFTCFWFTLSWVLKRGVSMYVEFRYLCRHTHASARRPDSEYL